MNEEQIQQAFFETLGQFTNVLDTIATNLDRIANALEQKQNEKGPRLRRPLSTYPNFDWASINAQVVAKDTHGATIVKSRERIWKRYTHTSYGADLWFSCGTGKDAQGKNTFIRLVTFVAPRDDSDTIEPLPQKVSQALTAQPSPNPHAARGKNKLYKSPAPTPRKASAPAIATPAPAPAISTDSELDKFFPRPDETQATADAESAPVPANHNDARQEFYKLLSPIMNTKALSSARANELMVLANLEGWQTALRALRGDVARAALEATT